MEAIRTEENRIKELLPEVQERVPLAPYTTFKIGGPARFFFVAGGKEDIVRAVTAAREAGVRFFLLAGGSNVLIPDSGFKGLVILLQDNENFTISGTTLQTDAGVNFQTLVGATGELGLSGFEWAGGLPGSIGGAIRGNAGAFGGEIKDTIVSVEYLDDTGRVRRAGREECEFSYRTSLFKKKGFVVLSGTFQFREGEREKIQAEAAEHVRYRKERHPLEYPNAGSVFKNCDVRNVPPEVAKEFGDKIKQDPFPVLPTAVLVAAAQLQGMRIGNAQISEKHTNYVVNLGNASSYDVLALIAKTKHRIRERFSVSLEEEVQYVE